MTLLRARALLVQDEGLLTDVKLDGDGGVEGYTTRLDKYTDSKAKVLGSCISGAPLYDVLI